MPDTPTRRSRPAPRPEDRLDFLSAVKGLGIVVVALFALNAGLTAALNTMLPQSAKTAIDARNVASDDYNKIRKERDEARRALDGAAPDAPDRADLQRRVTEREAALKAREEEIKALDRRVSDAVPDRLLIGYYTLPLALLAAGALVGGYLAARFARARRPGMHGAIAGMGIILIGSIIPNPLILVVEAAALAGLGFVGGVMYEKRKGPWDGVMPARPTGGLFGARRTASREGTEGVGDVVDADEAPSSDRPAPRPSLFGGLFGPRPSRTTGSPDRPSPRPSLFGGLFGPRQSRSRLPSSSSEGATETGDAIRDRDDRPAPRRSAPEVEFESTSPDAPDATEGAARFGPRGRKPRRAKPPARRPIGRGPNDDDLE